MDPSSIIVLDSSDEEVSDENAIGGKNSRLA